MKKMSEGSGMSDKNGDLGPSTFASLVLSLSSTAWVALGKIADPVTGKINMDLKGAKFSIDTLIMLRDKTKGNLTADEQKLLNGVIADLQANYAETVFSAKQEEKKAESGKNTQEDAGKDAKEKKESRDKDGTKSKKNVEKKNKDVNKEKQEEKSKEKVDENVENKNEK